MRTSPATLQQGAEQLARQPRRGQAAPMLVSRCRSAKEEEKAWTPAVESVEAALERMLALQQEGAVVVLDVRRLA